ncbi:MAG: hypothetical protein U5R14_10745 [Gemmatimonadota bacterium]|nr:hypothetical protein [Gemmatimonadota bacterium]
MPSSSVLPASRAVRALLGACLLALAVAAPPAPAAAQQAPSPAEAQRLIEQNPELVRQRIQQSGMSESRDPLAARSRRPPQRRARPVPRRRGPVQPGTVSGSDLAQAMQVLGIEVAAGRADRRAGAGGHAGSGRRGRAPADGGLPSSGWSSSARATSQFQPLLSGPVPSDYRVGPGDRLVLVLTGDVQLAHELEVTREGLRRDPQRGPASR